MLKNKVLLYYTFVVLGIAAISCAKEPDLIGLDLLPPADHLNMGLIDTSSLIAYTIPEDSLRTDELAVNLLGSIADPIFGTTTASIYTQYQLSKNNITFGENPVADSLVLTLTYKGIFGDSLTPKTITVYEIADSLSYDSAYYSTRSIPLLPEIIGQATFVPNLSEADSVGGNFMPPHMRIVLTPEFANKLITADTNTLKNNANFQKVFKGLYITSAQATTPGTGSILYLNLLDAVSRLKLYYHNTTDTTTLDFPIGSYSARFNNYNHYEYAGAQPELIQQFNGDTTLGAQHLYIQAMAGAKVKLRIPHLKALAAQKKMAVTEALLIINVDDTTGAYTVPATIALKKITSDGLYTSLPDEEEGTAFIDGTSNSGKSYQFRITRYIQDRLLNPDEPDYGLMLFAVGSSLTGNRVTLKGSETTEGKMRLLIYYTLVD